MFGFLEVIVSDNGTQLSSSFMVDFYKYLGVTFKKTTSRAHRTFADDKQSLYRIFIYS